MFSRKRRMSPPTRPTRPARTADVRSAALEPLESRSLLSAAPFGMYRPAPGPVGRPGAGHGNQASQTIEFSQAPTLVQSGLTSLAASDSLGTPTASQTVILGNANGIETYTINLSTTGTRTLLTVNQNGEPVTAPVTSTTTFGELANAAVTDRINAIATALNLTQPAADAKVTVVTTGDNSVYTVALASATTTSTRFQKSTMVSVDANGNPVGNTILPFSTLPAAIQNGLTANAPAGATALTATSQITIRTLNGLTTYSATFLGTGTRTTVTVDAAGELANLPSISTVQYSTLPAAAATALQTLATAKGYTGTIAATTPVLAYDQANGTVLYSLKLPITTTSSTGATYTYLLTLTVDQVGNPTVLPSTQPHGPTLPFGRRR